MNSRQMISNADGMQNSAMAQGYQSQQQLKVMSQQKVHKSPSSYMSEENVPPQIVLEQRKVKFYAQIEQIKDTRLIENLASIKTKQEKQKCIESFAEIYDAMMKNILEIGDLVKQIRFNEPASCTKTTNAPTIIHSQASNINNPNAASSLNPNAPPLNNAANNLNINDPKNNLEIAELPDQIIKDCKSIHNIYADLVQDSSLKHLELCCETFGLDGSAINMKFKISQWYNDIKEYVERNRPLTQQGRLSGKKSGSGKGLGSILCPCFGSKSKPTATTATTTVMTNQINRNNTPQVLPNQRMTLEPPN